jgi:hypothetical protein
MKLQKFVIIGLAILVVQLSACYEATLEKIGALGGGVVANKLADNTGAFRPLITGVGAIVGAELGRRLGKYLDEEEQKKLQQQMSIQAQNPEPQTSVVCTGKQGVYRSVSSQQARSMDCGSENKVILTTSATTKINGQECKDSKTEVINTQGVLETVNMPICKGTDGAWHGKSA